MSQKSRFGSVLAKDLNAFLAFKRALGFSYWNAESYLSNFDRYVQTHAPRHGALPLDRLVQGWLARDGRRKSVTVGRYLTLLRQFFLFRRRRDPDAYVPDHALAPQRKSHFEPHVLSLAQVRAVLAATADMRGPPLRRLAYRTLILVLYCTGLRLGEAIRLQLQDVDLPAMVLHIRHSKGKTREVPFKADLAGVLRRYLRARPTPAPTSCDRFLLQHDGRPYPTGRTSDVLRQLLRKVGLKPAKGREGPRPTDFRHYPDCRIIPRWCWWRLRRVRALVLTSTDAG